MIEYPVDKTGKEFWPGDLFIENETDDVIWDGKGKIYTPPIGIFTGESTFDGGWYVKTFKPGDATHEQHGRGPLYISVWDGEYVGKWDHCQIIGHVNEEFWGLV